MRYRSTEAVHNSKSIDDGKDDNTPILREEHETIRVTESVSVHLPEAAEVVASSVSARSPVQGLRYMLFNLGQMDESSVEIWRCVDQHLGRVCGRKWATS